MLRTRCHAPVRAVLRTKHLRFLSGLNLASHHPNAPLDIDPAFKALLKDVDMSLLHHKSRHHHAEDTRPKLRELEVYPEQDLASEVVPNDEESESRMSRKSPAALFGSQSIGAVIIPDELRDSVQTLISASDKHMLHADAKRLFLENDVGWDATYDVDYKSRKQAARHSERDGTAFVSIALPAHYSAIYSVLDHTRIRLGPEWNVDAVLDWGAGTGSGLWASAYVFQQNGSDGDTAPEHTRLINSTINKYVGIDKRQGLVSIGKRVLEAVEHSRLNALWQKAIHDEDKVARADGGKILALSAFLLSSLSTSLQRKALVKEMWESGAEVIVLIDHSTRPGFSNIIEAREYLLNLGRREVEALKADDSQIRGCHVVAPCPHDGACPLYHSDSTRLVCGFSQRLQRPQFVRKTKHSGTGHEDIDYSYVVIRRGLRPPRPESKVGRIGEIGRRELKKLENKAPMAELQLHDESFETSPPMSENSTPTIAPSETADVGYADAPAIYQQDGRKDFEDALRLEAFHWPRLIFPPLKRSGHIILDSCTAEGNIARMTVPKSQGKQPYYDARKSEWGDIFPHEPKNRPQIRHQSTTAKRQGGKAPAKGAGIGKRSSRSSADASISYSDLTNEVTLEKKKMQRERRRSHKAV